MRDIIESFFEHLAKHSCVPRLRNSSGNCRWNIEGAGSWTLSIKEGAYSVTKDSSEVEVDCDITCSKDDFIRMIQGQQNPMTVFLQGRIIVIGNACLAQICLHIFQVQPENIQQQKDRLIATS
jgi:putative sterol carrier protein